MEFWLFRSMKKTDPDNSLALLPKKRLSVLLLGSRSDPTVLSSRLVRSDGRERLLISDGSRDDGRGNRQRVDAWRRPEMFQKSWLVV